MKEIKIGLNRFNLAAFIEKIFDFMNANDISPRVVVCFSEDGDSEELDVDEINQSSIQELLFQGAIIFMPFSDINVGEPVPCADGYQHLLSDPEGLDEEVVMSVDEVESVGFLVQVEREMVIICPAVFKGGDYYETDPVEMDEDMTEFSESMSKFVKQFVKD